MDSCCTLDLSPAALEAGGRTASSGAVALITDAGEIGTGVSTKDDRVGLRADGASVGESLSSTSDALLFAADDGVFKVAFAPVISSISRRIVA